MESHDSMNLMAHRSDVDVWARRDWRRRAMEERLGHWLVSTAGASLVAYGTYCATRRSWRGLWWVASGASLIGCAAWGFGKANDGTARWSHAVEQASADIVSLESFDSFPASDAPSSNASTTTLRPL
jgi:hypothetical protein